MEAETSRSSGSADSYIGSLISLTSKSEIRYEGLLFNINASESTIGLTNVRSFGTEGRKKDGPQVPPSQKVFEYILFRGSDIKDLQVKASPPVQTPAPIYNDPAIIQSHYPQTSSMTTSFPSTVTGSFQDLNPHTSQLEVPNPTFQGSLPLYQSGGNSGSWASSLPLPTPNANGLTTQLYWQGYYGPSDGLQAQQQSLLQPPLGLSVPPSIQHRMEYTEFPAHMHVPPPTLGTSIPSVSPLSTVWGSSVNPPVVPEKPKIDTASAMLYTTVSEAEPYVAGTSGSFLNEGSTPSLVTPDQLLPPGITNASISQSSQTAQKDVEVVQGSSSGPPVPTVVESQAPIMPRPPAPDHKTYGAPSHTHHNNRGGYGRVRGNQLSGAPSHAHHNNGGGHGRRRENELSGAPSHTRHNNGGGHGRIRGNELSGAPSHTNHNNRGGHGRIRRDELSEVPSHAHQNNRGGHGRVRRNETSHHVTKFTEDFDFTAMNKKFNKDEVWGHLGKISKAQEDGDGYEDEDEDDVGPSKSESKPVYVKDDFFDSLSCDALGSRNGRTKFSEQVKVDTETFGEFARHRGGRSGRGFGGAGHSRGSYYGRSYSHYRRGRGHRTYAGMAESHLPD